jgi:RNA polymerase sigma factor (sigma-70 family)
LESLVDRHYASLYRFALSLTHAETKACDLTQETFHVWTKKGHQLRTPARVRSWLFTTLHRLFLETQRRQTRFPHIELEAAAGELPAFEPALVDRLDAARALTLLAQMDAPFRAPLALFYLEDYSYQEIAEILEVPLGTVKSRIARGLMQLRQRLLQEAASPRAATEQRP